MSLVAVESSELTALHDKVDEIMRRLNAMKLPEHPALTVVAFAKRVGRSRSTIHERIKDGTIVKKNGLIPHSELRKFLS